ncbi:MAG: DUF2480 family protein [Bacteroidia bacterium]|nr:DUF2480 family protein [Bacteroidia bacterium]MBP7260023.1 DUF2480 family protein [Bacteroidia bacterium]MBP9179730.1 DUF2480 family protein [Bacteroidia bacterium]MBP9723871.1 DUF2480 family protein [Bacteroidia bacterium]
MEQEIVNKVANSGLITIDLEELVDRRERVALDIKDQLFQGLLLREKDFRNFIVEHQWEQYRDKHVAVFCSTDAILPKWAFMLLAQALQPFAASVVYGSVEQLETILYQQALTGINAEEYRDKRIVIKGCGDKDVPTFAYVELTRILTPVAKSIMYGEPCSTVPVFKRK